MMKKRADDDQLISVAQMRQAEAAAIAGGVASGALMERAGRAAAAIIGAMCTAPRRALILCGPGSNGGDGYVIARHLRAHGYDVQVFALVPVAALRGDARAMAEAWSGDVLPFSDLAEWLAGMPPDVQTPLIIDALFGIGLARPLDAGLASQLAAINTAHAIRVAVDLPSGLDADTGAVLGAAFKSAHTITFHTAKPGHYLRPGALYCGDIHVADIGLGATATIDARTSVGGPNVVRNAPRDLIAGLASNADTHKYDKGHALVLAGGMESVGAARLAARGALRSGAGLVTLGVPGSALLAHVSRPPDALMIRRCNGAEGLSALLSDQRLNAVVLGPALGVDEDTRGMVRQVLETGRAAVLDADALTSFSAAAGSDVAALATLTQQNSNVVLTPHEGEFARLFQHAIDGQAPTVAAESRLYRALEAATFLQAVIVLKGPDTIIAAPDGTAAINTNAPQWLATAGSGDVLAGLIGGFLAQGLSPFDAARAGVWLHGEAGQLAGRGLIADDLPEAAASVLRAINVG